VREKLSDSCAGRCRYIIERKKLKNGYLAIPERGLSDLPGTDDRALCMEEEDPRYDTIAAALFSMASAATAFVKSMVNSTMCLLDGRGMSVL